jgi:hypothetical protein
MKYITKAIKENKVECSNCKALYSIINSEDKEKFFSVHGNICIGLRGGIVGNNLTKEGQVNRIMIYCFSCLIKYLQESISADKNSVIHNEDIFDFGDGDNEKIFN